MQKYTRAQLREMARFVIDIKKVKPREYQRFQFAMLLKLPTMKHSTLYTKIQDLAR